MKKFTFSFKSLLVAAGLLLGSANAWGADTSGKTIVGTTVTETYDFNGWGLLHLNSKTEATINKASETADHNVEETPVYEITNPVGKESATLELYHRFAMSNPGSARGSNMCLFYNSDKSGNRAAIGSNNGAITGYISILDLPKDATIVLTIQGTLKFKSANLKNSSDVAVALDDNVTNDETYTITTAGDVDIYAATWASIKKVVITYEADEEIVSVPSIAVAYNGANRTVTITSGTSSESNPVTTYYTTDGSTPTSSSSVYSSALDISSNCIVKAVTISDKGTSSDPASEEVTVGKIKLNAPSFKITDYSAGNFTVTITSDQSALDYVPASSTIYYSLDGGSKTEYTTPVSVPQGSTIAAHVENSNYISSSESELETGVIISWPSVWSQDYRNIVNSDVTMEQATSGGPFNNAVISNAGGDYYTYSSNGTSATTNINAGFQVYWSSSSNRKWLVRKAGFYSYGAGNTSLAIANLKTGQIVKVFSDTELTAGSGLSRLNNISYGTTWYFVATADGTGIINLARNKYIYTIDVYSPTVSATIGATGYTTFASSYALDLSNMTASEGDVTAYIASAQDGTNVTLNVAPNDVQAGEGLVLKGTAGATITIPVIASSANDPENLLVGCPTATEITAEMVATTTKYYVIANNGGTAQFQYLSAAITIPAGKAYLPVTTGGVKSLNIVVPDGTATGVDAPAVAEAEEEEILYNTTGVRVGKDYKGIVINQKGEKRLQK